MVWWFRLKASRELIILHRRNSRKSRLSLPSIEIALSWFFLRVFANLLKKVCVVLYNNNYKRILFLLVVVVWNYFLILNQTLLKFSTDWFFSFFCFSFSASIKTIRMDFPLYVHLEWFIIIIIIIIIIIYSFVKRNKYVDIFYCAARALNAVLYILYEQVSFQSWFKII